MGKVRQYSAADSHNKRMLVVVISNEKCINIYVCVWRNNEMYHTDDDAGDNGRV